MRIRIERLSPPDYDSGWSRLYAKANTASYRAFAHPGGGRKIARVRVLSRAITGPHRGYVFEAQGSAQADDDLSQNKFGGVVFAYDEHEVRVWAPSTTTRGSIINVPQGWVRRSDLQSEENEADVRVVVWYGLPEEESDLYYSDDGLGSADD